MMIIDGPNEEAEDASWWSLRRHQLRKEGQLSSPLLDGFWCQPPREVLVGSIWHKVGSVCGGGQFFSPITGCACGLANHTRHFFRCPLQTLLFELNFFPIGVESKLSPTFFPDFAPAKS